jgi:hypothetical protein
VVAVSGPDNIGKSTQIRLLARRTGMVDMGRLDANDTRWTHITQVGLADWWFSGTPIGEVVDVLARSYLARSAAGPHDGPVRLIDRGIPMLEASIVATVAVREGRDHRAAAERAAQLLAPYRSELDAAEAGELGILLLHDADPEASTARALSREADVSPRYAAYQSMLGRHLALQSVAGRFAETIIVGDRSILAVQQELGSRLRSFGLTVPDVSLESVRVVAVGGLSESGKSTAGHYLQVRHGHARLKIGYLLRLAGTLHGITDVYTSDAASQAELLVDALEEFCVAHRFQRQLTIESLHRLEMTRELMKLLGSRLTVVYLDAQASAREARGMHGPDDVRERDEVKQARGADRIRDIADLVIDNNGTRAAIYYALDRLVADHRWHLTTPRLITVGGLSLPAHLATYVETLLDRTTTGLRPLASLVAVTGSGGRGKYQEGWSDLDVLLVAGVDCLTELRDVLAGLATHLEGVKLGLTVVSEAECRAGVLTPRLLHTLVLIGSGQLPVLWRTDHLCLPRPDAEADALASMGDGAAAAVEMRRLLVKPTLDVRALFKVTALLAKVVLRADDEHHAGDDQALRAFLGRAQLLPCSFGDDIVGRARCDQRAAEALAVHVLACWLTTLPAAVEQAGTRP